ncbi:hypothetical protein NFHSH190041_27930 [Shewanella sp. NFH-SH190041]|nr:hypothetical protein NFHSH190041_27930 [Shewanella sp. NFH-SH190041]
MYGMVNKFIGRTISQEYGEPAWQQICQQAGYPDLPIDAVTNYPDAITFDLVAAACCVLQAPQNELLQLLGQRWVSFTAQEDYTELFAVTGSDFYSFMCQLNKMHASLQLQMPGLKPPFFHVEKLTEQCILIEYYSERHGLAAFTQGLLQGLCEYFSYPAQVRLLESGENSDYEAAFMVEELA